ncbi:MFS transporter [Streptomyces thermoviolaceus]|uniref:MFS transporter n=1 Tax=Streptomyces thermoviolaceus TaxID=1952 RepID=UPI0016777A84|nr:MFS transporter [Streptomyces thermoviolaceus]MCM3263335.1 MFS transporter [Streptomyces thermoviolaceus]WTD46967.1 MFS transporter [Streptomyces thermoviolaceus]GGV71594.1 MFS transporter [Streptomyces thermoviolaceus subsp. apingens]
MSSPGTTETPAPSPARAETGNRLPVGRLLAFTTAGFLAIMTETMPAGLLPQIGDGLDVTEAWAGQLVTLYAIGSTVAAIPIIAATRSMNRRPLLLWAVGGLLVFNTVTALSALYGLTLFARFVAGMASGVIWGVLAGYARRLVPAALQGRALAIVGVGQPIALTFGVPLGTWLGSLFDWRGVFWIMSAVALLLMLWVRALVPDVPGQSAAERLPIRRIFTTPGVRPVLAVVFFWILAHNILYTYIAPFLEKAGLKDRVDVALLVFGAAAIVGIWATGVLVDRMLRTVTLISLAAFAAAAVVLGIGHESPWVVFPGIVAWGLTFGGAPTLLQTAIADAAGEGADVAQSMLVTIFNLAVAGGGLVGGLLLETAGAAAFPWALLVLALAALAVVAGARSHGFTPGHRVAP